MENRKELLEQYMEDGKLPLKGELFARKSVVGGKLEEFREEKRADALTSRPNAAGRQKLIVLRSSCIYWRVAALFILLFLNRTNLILITAYTFTGIQCLFADWCLYLHCSLFTIDSDRFSFLLDQEFCT